jgi:hypothetical protein
MKPGSKKAPRATCTPSQVGIGVLDLNHLGIETQHHVSAIEVTSAGKLYGDVGGLPAYNLRGFGRDQHPHGRSLCGHGGNARQRERQDES